MSTSLAELLLLGVAGGLAPGIPFAIWFVLVGAGRLDPAARQGSVGFRLLLVPGSVLLWPLLLWRTLTRRGNP